VSVLSPWTPEPGTGRTPRREIARRGKARLYRYGGAPRVRIPLLFIPNLGISRPWIFDLLPGSSFVEYMVDAGFDFYLLDWGVFGPEDDDMSFDDCVTGTLRRMCNTVLDTSAVGELFVIGYCMGTALTLSLAASRPDLPLRAFVNMAGPVDFSKAGLLARWLDPRWFDVDRLVDTLGSIPPPLIWLGGTLLSPTAAVSAMLDLWSSRGEPRRVDELRAYVKWVREFVGIPGAFFRQWVRDFYQDNALYRGTLVVGGRAAHLETVTCPVLLVTASDDPVAPRESVHALLDVVGSRDTAWIEARGSHLSLMMGAEATGRLWPAISRWLVSHDSPVARDPAAGGRLGPCLPDGGPLPASSPRRSRRRCSRCCSASGRR
jgi:polyhydroxyalkanoate synthase